MARKRNAVTCEEAKMDMTSMIDVTFLLIIFFMCVTETANLAKDRTLKLPVADRAIEDVQEAGRLTINIDKKGLVKIMGQEYSTSQLDQVLQTEKALSWDKKEQIPTRAILIRIDKETPFYHVATIMKQCMRYQLWKLMFATKQELG